MVDIIHKKREGKVLNKEEITYFIEGFVNQKIPDYQVSALLMAIYFHGMAQNELANLTKAMVESGDQIDLSSINGIKVDKHSTGGVGDTTTLILAPLVAACGTSVAKMSGRGLGHTGGTIDKLEAFDGFNVEISNETFIDLVNRNQIALISQSGNLTPADKLIYALRDVTATVDSIPLMASSIMSKKIAAGTDAIVLDVKVGDGAFMKNIDEARDLAQTMVHIGNDLGRKTVAVISDMNQPLGKAVGNALEVKEAIATLNGEGPRDLEELCLTLGSQMLVLAGDAPDAEAAREKLLEVMKNGKAYEKFITLIESQGGNSDHIKNPDLLPKAPIVYEVHSETEGYIESIHSEQIGMIAMLLGAGRATKDDVIDQGVGVVLEKKLGDYVKQGDVLLTLHMNSGDQADTFKEKVLNAFEIGSSKPKLDPLIHGIIQ